MRTIHVRTLIAVAVAAGTVASAILPAAAAGPAPGGVPASRSEVRWAPPPSETDLRWRLPPRAEPSDNAGTPGRVELGRLLFFDPRLSGNGAVSCATCHNPSLGWSDGLRTGVGIHGQVLKRGTPTIANTAYLTQLMWDGRHRTLEEQAIGPMRASDEMASDLPAVMSRLASIPGYANRFAAAYPGEGVSERSVAKALSAFQRTIVVDDTPFDRWLAGERKAMSIQAWRGYQVFVDPKKGNCEICHSAPGFTDNGFHNIGLREGGTRDPGRFTVRKVASLRGAFKTPTLRDVERTAPYFRDGSAATLLEVVEHYARGGDDHDNLSPNIRPLDLTEQDKADLVVFMRALTGRSVAFPLPVLPQ